MMEDFLFHKVSKKEKEEIKKKAKQIMGSFSKKLFKIDEKSEEAFVERDNCERQEKVLRGIPREGTRIPRGHKTSGEVTQSPDQRASGKCEDLDKEIMFENAPIKNKDFIIAERGGWE